MNEKILFIIAVFLVIVFCYLFFSMKNNGNNNINSRKPKEEVFVCACFLPENNKEEIINIFVKITGKTYDEIKKLVEYSASRNANFKEGDENFEFTDVAVGSYATLNEAKKIRDEIYKEANMKCALETSDYILYDKENDIYYSKI